MAAMIKRVLVVDDDEQYLGLIPLQLAPGGIEVKTASSAARALEVLEQEEFDLILTDVVMPGMSGIDLLTELARHGKACPVIVMSAYGSVDTAIEAMKKGAYDYVSKPFRKDELTLAIRKLEEREFLRRRVVRLEEELHRVETFDEIVGVSERMREVFALVRKVAPYRTTVLLAGESGTGKELVARALHRESPRKEERFVALNCAAIPEHLLESELFGHVRGAFTDAHADKKGLFEEADGGTLFLDEIGELPLPLQVKLLRTLQDGEVRRIGSTKAVKVDVRVVAATARNLAEEVAAARFREDLFYRLNVVQVVLPPLRDRIADIAPLVRHFIDKTNERLGTKIEGIDAEAMKVLLSHAWPGNVRELENTIERAAVLTEGAVIHKDNLPFSMIAAGRERLESDPDDLSLKKATARLEESYIRRALIKTGGNRTRAAQILELSHRALLYKIRDYGINVPPQGKA
jgi:two-component system response regulator AtoC